MLQEIKVAIRRLAHTPGFTATALLTLALCVGANLTILSVVDAILIRSLPYAQPDRLVTLYFVYPKMPSATSGASLTNYYERRGKIPALSSIATIERSTSVVGEVGYTAIENLGRVTPEFFDTLGVRLFMGRGFNDEEMTYNTDQVAIVSFEFWKGALGGDPNVIGRTVRTDGLARKIVGVLPPEFRYLSFKAPIYLPLSSEEDERNVGARHSTGKVEIARLKPGATIAEVQSQVDELDTAIAPLFPDAKIVAEAGCHTVVAPLREDYVASVKPMILLLQAGALLLLLIGGVNVSNLLLIRASNRSRELAIRQALGAGRRQILNEVMTETLLLAMVGVLLGLCVGAIGIRLLTQLGAQQLPLGSEIAFNYRLAAVAMLGALLIGGALGVPVAWFSLGGRLTAAIQDKSRGATASRTTQHLRHGFIVAQISLAFILLTGACLLGISLRRAMSLAPGYATEHVITGRFSLTWFAYHAPTSYDGFFDRLLEKAGRLPGVSSVGAISNVPLSDNKEADAMTVPGSVIDPGNTIAVHDELGVAGNYFEAMGIPLIEGRFLRPGDEKGDDRVCVVDEAFARRYWKPGTEIGMRVYQGTRSGPNDKAFRVVGVVGSVAQNSLTEANPRGSIYFTFDGMFSRNYFLVVRTNQGISAAATALQRAVREVDPDMPLTDIRTMDMRVSDNLAPRRSPALMAGFFALSALLLATIGIYGVMAYTVSQRTKEIGIRIALGAGPRNVLRLILGQGAGLAALGLGLGVLGALAFTRLMASMLYSVASDDPRAYAAVATVLGAVAGLACLVPARRATKVDPVVSLRAD